CNSGSFTHGFLAPEKVSLYACVDIALFDKTGYFPASEFGGVPRMSEAPNFVAYGPLHKIGFEPDVVLMVCNPQQAMLVGEAASAPRLMGAPTCAAIPMDYNDGRVGVRLGGITNTIRTGIKPSEMIVTVPRDERAGFTEKLRRRAKANVEVGPGAASRLTAA